MTRSLARRVGAKLVAIPVAYEQRSTGRQRRGLIAREYSVPRRVLAAVLGVSLPATVKPSMVAVDTPGQSAEKVIRPITTPEDAVTRTESQSRVTSLSPFDVIRTELALPGLYPLEALTEAEHASRTMRLPDLDETAIPLVTLAPTSTTYSEQAIHIERRAGGGYRLHYAVPDIAAFVAPGGSLDAEAHRRGETYYLPDRRIPLYPEILSENAASLVPGRDRPALLWRIDLDSAAELVSADVRRARVRSQGTLTMLAAQAAMEMGNADPALLLLREVGQARQEREIERGGIHLDVPEQVVSFDNGTWTLGYKAPLPVENWKAQISLLAGMAAAEVMMYGEIGLLRTMPDPPPVAYHRLHRVARALKIRWPDGASYSELIRMLDPALPNHAAFLQQTTALMRGARYTAFDGDVPVQPGHSALAATYAHVTAPLQRLADRYAGEACVALCAGAEVPDWVRSELPKLPAVMEISERRASAVARECIDLVEVLLLKDKVGEVFDAVVIDLNERIDWNHSGKPDVGIVQLTSPAVRARCDGHELVLGQEIKVRLAEASLATRRILFEALSPRHTVRNRPGKETANTPPNDSPSLADNPAELLHANVLLSMTGADPEAGLHELADWLSAEPELHGLVTAAQATPQDGQLGVLSPALVAAVSGGAARVLAASLRAFLAVPRSSALKIAITGSGGRRVEIDAQRIADVDALLREVLGQYG